MPHLNSRKHWLAYEEIPLPCLWILPDLRVAAVNKAYEIQHDCNEKQIVNRNYFELIEEDHRTIAALKSSIETVLATNSPDEVQAISIRHTCSGSNAKKLVWNIKNIPFPTGREKPAGVIQFFSPVKSSGDNTTHLSSAAPDSNNIINTVKDYAIFSLDTQGIITSWNKGAENIKGYTADETIGRSMELLYTKQDIAEGRPAKNLEFALQNDGYETEGWRLRKDGTAFYAHIVFTPLFDEQGIHYAFSKVTRDITQERNDRERNNFLADITRNIEDPIISTDTGLTITRWNQAAERLFGWRENEAIGKTTEEILRSQFSTSERNYVLKSLQYEGYWHGQVTYLTKAANKVVCLCTISHLKDAQNRVTGNLILLKDITSRIEAETALAAINEELESLVTERTNQLVSTEKKFENLFENNPMPMWVISQDDFRFLAVNYMAVFQYGYSREEFLSMTALDIRPRGEKDMFVNSDHSPQTTAENFNKGVWKHRKKNGEVISVQIMAHQIMFEGIPAKMILANDVTAKLLAEEKIAAREKQLSNTLNNMLEGIQVHDFDWRYVFVNDARVAFERSSREELIGTRLMDRYPGIEETDGFKAMSRVMQQRKSEQLETEFIFADGRKARYQLSIQPVPEGILVLSIDITERLKVQEEYVKAQENYRTIMERISDAFVAFDTDWNFEYINRAACKILNRTREELMGKNVWKEFPEFADYKIYKAFHQALENQEHIQLEEFYATFNLWTQFNIYPSPQGITVFFSNISKRKRAEEKVMQSESNLKAIFDNTSEGFILTDKEGNIKVCNNRVTEFVIPGIAEMRTGGNIFEITEAARLEFFTDVFNRVLSGEMVQYDRQFTTADGRVLWISLAFNPVSEDGSVNGVCITARNITERRWAEDQLQKNYFEKRELADKLSAILNTLPANIALVDSTGRIVEINDSWRNFAIENGYQGAHFGLGENYLSLSRNAGGPEQQDGLTVAEGLSRVLEEDIPEFVYEYPCDSPEDERWFRMIATPLQRKEYAGAVIMHLDISELKRLEAERMRLQMNEQQKITQAILQGQEKERNHIGRELHDNINQILAGTKLYLSVAANKDPQVNDSLKYPIELLDQSIEEIRKLCANMVTPLEDVKLKDLTEDLLIRLNSAGIKTSLVYRVQDNLLSDELKLNIYRIVQELCTNIIKYAKAARVEVEVISKGHQLLLMVTDDGIGFNTSIKKNGIGLSNIRSRVQSFDGIVSVTSSEGEGTVTTISIPVK